MKKLLGIYDGLGRNLDLAEMTPKKEGTVMPVNGKCEEAEVPRVVCLQYLKTTGCKGHCCTFCSVQTAILPGVTNAASSTAGRSLNHSCPTGRRNDTPYSHIPI